MNTWRFFQMKRGEGVIMLQVRVLPPEICSWVLAALVRGRRPHGDWRFQQPKICFYVQNWMGLSQWRYFFNFWLHGLGLLILKYVSFSTRYFPFGHTVGFPTMSILRAWSLENSPKIHDTTRVPTSKPRGDFSRWSLRAQTFSKAVVIFCGPKNCHHEKCQRKGTCNGWSWMKLVILHIHIHTAYVHVYIIYIKWTVKASWWWSCHYGENKPLRNTSNFEW